MNCMNFIWPLHHGAFAGFKKKNKWANRLPRGQKGELGMLGIDRAMFTLILASVFVIAGLSNLTLKIKFPQS